MGLDYPTHNYFLNGSEPKFMHKILDEITIMVIMSRKALLPGFWCCIPNRAGGMTTSLGALDEVVTGSVASTLNLFSGHI